MNKEDEYSFTINSEGKKYTFQGMYAGTIDSSWWRWQFSSLHHGSVFHSSTYAPVCNSLKLAGLSAFICHSACKGVSDAAFSDTPILFSCVVCTEVGTV